MEDVRLLNNSKFGDYVDRIFPIELEIMNITGTDRTASYFDLPFQVMNSN
jgi:hypothetical protein